MSEKITVPIGDMKLIACVNDWQDGMPKEICVFLETKHGVIWQDICLVREHYSYNQKTCEFEIDSNFVDCRVWGDSDSEDYTHEFVIGVYEDD